MQDKPSAIELIEAVTGFIREHAMPQLQGHTAFHARVAANALDIVKRELEIGPEDNAAERTRLQKLLGHDGELDQLNAELCDKIAGGDLDLTTPGLKDHLWATTLTKLAIDQPKYAAYRKTRTEGMK